MDVHSTSAALAPAEQPVQTFDKCTFVRNPIICCQYYTDITLGVIPSGGFRRQFSEMPVPREWWQR